MESTTLLTNNVKVVAKNNIFSRFSTPRAIICDGGSHFVNNWFRNFLVKYEVRHKVTKMYHPHTNGQVEVSNC